jgi:hypothetical protein
MKFNDVTIEAIDYGVRFYERPDHKGRITGYTVEREDGRRASMLLDAGGRRWRVAMSGSLYIYGSKAQAANRALDLVANAD